MNTRISCWLQEMTTIYSLTKWALWCWMSWRRAWVFWICLISSQQTSTSRAAFTVQWESSGQWTVCEHWILKMSCVAADLLLPVVWSQEGPDFVHGRSLIRLIAQHGLCHQQEECQICDCLLLHVGWKIRGDLYHRSRQDHHAYWSDSKRIEHKEVEVHWDWGLQGLEL